MARVSNGIVFLLIILTGAILGGIIGDLLGGIIPVLNYGETVGIDQFKLDLSIVQLTFGLTMTLNLAGIIGIVLSIFFYRKVR